MVVDPASGEVIADPHPAIFEEAQRAAGEHRVVYELLRSQMETNSRICASVAELRTSLEETRGIVIDAARRHGAAVIASSLHPWARWQSQQVTPRRRYQEAEITFQHSVRQFFVGGMHIHAGFGDPGASDPGDDRPAAVPPDPARDIDLVAVPRGAAHRPQVVPADRDRGPAPHRDAARAPLPCGVRRHRGAVGRSGPSRMQASSGGTSGPRRTIRPSSFGSATSARASRTRWPSPRSTPASSASSRGRSGPARIRRSRRTSSSRRGGGSRSATGPSRSCHWGDPPTLVDVDDCVTELVEGLGEDARALECESEIAHIARIVREGSSADRQEDVYRQAMLDGASEDEALRRVLDSIIEETERGSGEGVTGRAAVCRDGPGWTRGGENPPWGVFAPRNAPSLSGESR